MAIVATQLRKGVLEHCVLALLRDQPRYGYELVQELARVDGMLTTEGTIYPLLLRLHRDGLVQTERRDSSDGPPRKYYRLTPAGRRALGVFQDEWRLLRAAVDGILEGGGR